MTQQGEGYINISHLVHRCSQNQSYIAELTLTGCYDTEFNCDDGSCVSMEMRCDGKAHCKDSSDESKCHILDHGIGYDKLIVPVNKDTGKLEVTISVDILNVLEIKEVSEEVTIKSVLVREFFDSRLTYTNLKEDANLNKLSQEEVDSLWYPLILFHNVAKQSSWEEFLYRREHTVVRNPDKSHYKGDLTYANNVYLYRGAEHKQRSKKEMNVVWICNYDMRMYPFDTQICTMDLYIEDSEKVILVAGNLTYQGPMDLAQYFVHNYWICSSRFGNDRSGLIVILILGRPLIGHILTVFIPTTILIVLAHMSKVFADNYVDMVIQVNFTALLVLATL